MYTYTYTCLHIHIHICVLSYVCKTMLKAEKLKGKEGYFWLFKEILQKVILRSLYHYNVFKKSCCLSFWIKYFLLLLFVLHTNDLFIQWDYKCIEENNTLFQNSTCCCLCFGVTGGGFEQKESQYLNHSGGQAAPWLPHLTYMSEAFLQAALIQAFLTPYSLQRNTILQMRKQELRIL